MLDGFDVPFGVKLDLHMMMSSSQLANLVTGFQLLIHMAWNTRRVKGGYHFSSVAPNSDLDHFIQMMFATDIF